MVSFTALVFFTRYDPFCLKAKNIIRSRILKDTSCAGSIIFVESHDRKYAVHDASIALVRGWCMTS